MKRTLRSLLVLTATIAATFAFAVTSAGAGPFTAGPLVQVSDTSPFVSCTADNVPEQLESGAPDAKVFPDSEVEPWIDVNPTDEDNLVGMWQADRWSNGGARGHVAGVSFNGGSQLDAGRDPRGHRVLGRDRSELRQLPAHHRSMGLVRPRTGPCTRSRSPSTTSEPFKDEDEDGFDDFDHALLASKSDGWRPHLDPTRRS